MSRSAIRKKTCLKLDLLKTAAVLTISDSSSQGKREDLSGPAAVRQLEGAGFQVVRTAIIPDELEQIGAQLIACCEQARLVVTVGGTGLALRDVTPEATLAVVERTGPGIAERIRGEGAKKTPFAVLSRGGCGVRGKSLILNLPRRPPAAPESLPAVVSLLPHALELLDGHTAHQ